MFVYINNLNTLDQAIKLRNLYYLLLKHFDPYLNLFPSLYVPSIRKKRRSLSLCLLYSQKNIPIMF